MAYEIDPVAVDTQPRLQIVRKRAWLPASLEYKLKTWKPASHLGAIIKECLKILPDPDMAAELLEAITSCVVLESRLAVVVIRADGRREDHGIVSRKVITTAGVNFLVDAWENTAELENMKYHGLGTGTTAEAVGDTALVTELTTQYNPDNTRATGTLVDGAGANILQTVATNTLDGAATIQEHGLFSQAATGGGTLWDRSLTGAQTLSSGDGLQTTYNMTASAGG